MTIEINFPGIACPKCKDTAQYATMRGNRYGIYCRSFGHFIKWADKGQTAVINGRAEWLKEHAND